MRIAHCRAGDHAPEPLLRYFSGNRTHLVGPDPKDPVLRLFRQDGRAFVAVGSARQCRYPGSVHHLLGKWQTIRSSGSWEQSGSLRFGPGYPARRLLLRFWPS